MTTKYEMPDLRAKLVRIIESEWPLTLEELEDYDQRREELQKRKHDQMDGLDWSDWPLHLVPEPAAAISIGSKFHILSILPAAYYDLSRCTTSNALDLPWYDSEDTGNSNNDDAACGRPVRWGFVTAAVHQNLMRVQEVKESAAFMIRQRCAADPGYYCETDYRCRDIWCKLLRKTATCQLHRDILKCLRDLEYGEGSKALLDELCQSCMDTFREKVIDMRKNVWQTIVNITKGVRAHQD